MSRDIFRLRLSLVVIPVWLISLGEHCAGEGKPLRSLSAGRGQDSIGGGYQSKHFGASDGMGKRVQLHRALSKLGLCSR
jgi:hypothetical protein